MDITDRLYSVSLFDYYCDMLTDKQQTILAMFYYEDCGLSEIADVLNISRQAVLDAIKSAERELARLEEKIGCVKRAEFIKKDLLKLSALPEVKSSKDANAIISRISERI